MLQKIYPRSKDKETVYLKSVITNPNIIVGDYTMYNDFVKEPKDFEKNNVLYQYPINQDKLIIGKFCSIACGAKFIFNSANHTLSSLSTYPFPIFFEEWGLDVKDITKAWDNKGDMGTKAQQALKLQHEQNKMERKVKSKEQREAEKERQYALRQEKRKAKHRGK